MARVYTTQMSRAMADYVASTVALNVGIEAEVNFWPGSIADDVTLALSEAAVEYLRTLSEDADAQVDGDGRLWIGGTDYILEVDHNPPTIEGMC